MGKTAFSNRLSAFLALLLLLTVCAGPALAAGGGDAAARVVKVGVVPSADYAEQDENGVWTGYDVEIIENMAQYAGLRAEIVSINSPEKAISGLEDGTLDIMDDMAMTAERGQHYLFSEDPTGSSSLSVAVAENNDTVEYGNVEQLSRLRFAVSTGSAGQLFTAWCQKHGFTPQLQQKDTLDALYTAVNTGSADAVVVGADSIPGYRTVLTFSPTSYYFMFRQDQLALKNTVDSAMAEMLAENPMYQKSLFDKYGFEQHGDDRALTRDEKQYIAGHSSVRVAVLDNDEPYFYYGKDRQPSGILPELYRTLSQATGLQFTFQAYKTQKEAVGAVTSGAADVLGMYSDGLPYAFDAGLRITREYTSVSMVMVTRRGADAVSIGTVACKERSRNAILQNLSGRLREAKVVGCNTAGECFDMLRQGKADAVVFGLPSATYLVNQTNAGAYTITPLSSVTLQLCGAVSYENHTLASILNKGIGESNYAIDGIVANNTLPRSTLSASVARIPPVTIIIFAVVMTLAVVALIWSVLILSKNRKAAVAVVEARAEADQQRIRAEAIEKSALEKNAFFSNISHDMRTPLNAILGFTTLAKKQDIDEAQRANYLDDIQSSGELLLSLINDTLTISKFNSGKLELHPVPMDTEAIGWSITTPIRTIAAQKNIGFTMDKSGYRPRVILADQLNLQKIFLNLLNNAVKYTPEGGHIWVTVKDVPPDAPDPDIEITVRDNGIGISEEFLPRIFEPFAQEKRHGYETVGTGLGLSIVKQLVELMGGTITVQSEKNCGSVFTVRLHFPEVEGAAQRPAGGAAAAAAQLAGKKVLLCEDNALNREIAVAFLEDIDMQTVEAENGSVGVELFAKSAVGEYAAILMDLRMPVMDGFEATRTIRAMDRPDAGTIPILAMTADAFADDVQRCLAAGMNAHIAKPVDPGQLFAALSGNIR